MSFVTEELAFQSDSLCREFLSQFGVVYADGERTKIDCKTSSAAVTSAWETMWTLYGQCSNYSVLKTFSDEVTHFFKFRCTRFIFCSVGFTLIVKSPGSVHFSSWLSKLYLYNSYFLNPFLPVSATSESHRGNKNVQGRFCSSTDMILQGILVG